MLNDIGITKEDVIDRAAEKLIDGFDEDYGDLRTQIVLAVKTEMVKRAESQIDSILEASLADLLDTDFQPIDEWGDKKGSKTTLRKLVKEKSMAYLKAKVDENGKESTYRAAETRANWLAKKAAKDAIDYETRKEIEKAVDTAKSEIKQIVAKHITERILSK